MSTWGGKRQGSGRPKIGSSRVIRLTLPEEDWEKIDSLIENEHVTNLAEYFRKLHEAQYQQRGRMENKC